MLKTSQFAKLSPCQTFLLYGIVEKYILHELLNPYKHLPWLSKNIKLQMKKRKKLHGHARSIQSIRDWETHRKARNQVIMFLSAAHQNYYYILA